MFNGKIKMILMSGNKTTKDDNVKDKSIIQLLITHNMWWMYITHFILGSIYIMNGKVQKIVYV